MPEDNNRSADALCAEGWRALVKLGPSGGDAGKLGFFDRRRFQTGQTRFAAALALDPNHWRSLWGMAQLNRAGSKTGDPIKAITLFERAVLLSQADPASPTDERVRLLTDATLACLSAGDGRKAEQLAREAALLQAGDPTLLANLALALLLRGEGKRALGAITNAIKLAPEDGGNREILEYVRQILDGSQPYPTRLDV